MWFMAKWLWAIYTYTWPKCNQLLDWAINSKVGSFVCVCANHEWKGGKRLSLSAYTFLVYYY